MWKESHISKCLIFQKYRSSRLLEKQFLQGYIYAAKLLAQGHKDNEVMAPSDTLIFAYVNSIFFLKIHLNNL